MLFFGQSGRQTAGIFGVKNRFVCSVQDQSVARQCVCFDDFSNHTAELAQAALAARFVLQKLKTDAPRGLVAAMLSAQLVQASLQRLAKPKIIWMQGQYLMGSPRFQCNK